MLPIAMYKIFINLMCLSITRSTCAEVLKKTSWRLSIIIINTFFVRKEAIAKLLRLYNKDVAESHRSQTLYHRYEALSTDIALLVVKNIKKFKLALSRILSCRCLSG